MPLKKKTAIAPRPPPAHARGKVARSGPTPERLLNASRDAGGAEHVT